MFPRVNRLRRRRDIQRILSKGRRVSDQYLLIRIASSAAARFRVTVVVGTVVDKRAVVRNRIKRQVRADLREEIKSRSIPPTGKDIMVTVKRPALNRKKNDRRASLHELLRRAGF